MTRGHPGVIMETKDRLLFDLGPQLALQPGSGGFLERTLVTFPVGRPRTYFDLEGGGANLIVATVSAGRSAPRR